MGNGLPSIIQNRLRFLRRHDPMFECGQKATTEGDRSRRDMVGRRARIAAAEAWASAPLTGPANRSVVDDRPVPDADDAAVAVVAAGLVGLVESGGECNNGLPQLVFHDGTSR